MLHAKFQRSKDFMFCKRRILLMRPALRIGLFHFMLYVKGIQLWSCLDAQLLHHTFLGQASPGGTLPVSFP